MNISFISTVFNEEDTIEKFLESLFSQSLKPSEVIIVDGGSNDNTFKLIKKYNKKLGIKVFRKKGNRSVGRNFAIKKAIGDVIAVSDAGCVLEKNWLLKITKPFLNKKIEVAAGYYKPTFNNTFEKSLSTYTCFPEDKIDENFLPSSRSIAFRKEAWKKVGGYPEELNTCEDLVFARKLKRKGLKFSVVKKAIVFWPQRTNLAAASKQFFDYAVGDGKALYIRRQTPLLFLRYIVGFVLTIFFVTTNNFLIFGFIFILFSLYILWSILKNYDYVNKTMALIYLPLLQMTSDIMVLTGFSWGFLQRLWGTKR